MTDKDHRNENKTRKPAGQLPAGFRWFKVYYKGMRVKCDIRFVDVLLNEGEDSCLSTI